MEGKLGEGINALHCEIPRTLLTIITIILKPSKFSSVSASSAVKYWQVRPSVQLPGVSGVDSKLGHNTTVMPSFQSVPERPFLEVSMSGVLDFGYLQLKRAHRLLHPG